VFATRVRTTDPPLFRIATVVEAGTERANPTVPDFETGTGAMARSVTASGGGGAGAGSLVAGGFVNVLWR